MYISEEDYAKGIEFVIEKAEYVEPTIALHDDSSKNYQQMVADLQSKSRFLQGMESYQVQQTLLMAEGLMVIQNQLTTIIKLLKDL